MKQSTEFSGPLRAQALKKSDVKTLSRLYGLSDSEAAILLISDGVNGRQIQDRVFRLNLNNNRSWGKYGTSRPEAAQSVFGQIYGSPEEPKRRNRRG